MTPDQAIAKLRTLPEDKQRKVLTALSPDERKGILGKLSAPKTPGEEYMAKRRAGALPKKEVTSFSTNPQQALAEAGQEAGEIAQEYQTEATPAMFREGKYAGDRPLLDQAANAIASGTFEMIGVGAKLASGLTDWKTAAAFLVSKLSPAASAAFFATQGAKQAYDAVRNGDTSPENVQNFLLGLSTVSGATAGGMAEKSATPADIKKGISERVHSFARRSTEATQDVKAAVKESGEKHAEATARNRAEREEAMRGNMRMRQEQLTKDDQTKIKVQDKNRQIEAENTRAQEEQAAQVNQRNETLRTVDEQSNQLGTKIRDVEQKVGREANRKFEEVRAKIGNPEAPSDDLLEAVATAQDDVLQGIPEKVKEFQAILKMEGAAPEVQEMRAQIMETQGLKGKYENLTETQRNRVDFAVAQESGGIPEANEPVTWDKLQRLKTVIDDRMRARNVDPTMKRALGTVRDRIIEYMGQMAEQAGAGAEWGEARNFYRQWKEDFWEPSGPSGSGSPVAQAVEAVDPKNIRQPFLRTQATTGNRGVDILRKYGNYGGTEAATLAQQMIENQKNIGRVPTPAKPKALQPTPEVFPQPRSKPVPAKIPGQATVDIDQVARESIERTARRVGRLNAWDARVIAGSVIAGVLAPFLGLERGIELGATYVGTKLALAKALENPKVMDWIARTPENELRSLYQLPNIDKVNVQTALTDAAIKAKATPSPQLQRFLGAKNVARILAAQGNRPVQNRREAVQVLGQQ